MAISKSKQVVNKTPIKIIFEKFSRHKDVSLVFGEPIELENKRVLPVAKVIYTVGGGGGVSEASENSTGAQGEGGGGFFAIKPVGVYEITHERVTFKPIFEFKYIILLLSVFTFGFFWMLKKGLSTQNASKHHPFDGNTES